MNSTTETLNTLFKSYGLIYDPNNKRDSDVFISKNFKIITRSGIQKIQAILEISSTYEVVFVDPFSMVLKGKFFYEDKSSGKVVHTETFGEASVDRIEHLITERSVVKPDGTSTKESEVEKLLLVAGNVKGDPPYLAAMAEKRALSRGVLQLAGLYKHGVFSEDESDEFKREVKKQMEE